MILGIHQSQYLPWSAYFRKIAKVVEEIDPSTRHMKINVVSINPFPFTISDHFALQTFPNALLVRFCASAKQARQNAPESHQTSCRVLDRWNAFAIRPRFTLILV